LVCHLKDGIGNVYIYPAGSVDCGEEYVYHIYVQADKPVRIKVGSVYSRKVLFDGLVSKFDPEALEKADNEEE